MSRKMFKRTAALSALIAISLSGTVMAAELTVADEAAYSALQQNADWYHEHEVIYPAGITHYIYSTDSFQNNTITIGAADGRGPNMGTERIYGSRDVTVGNAVNNTVNINGGTFGILYGGSSGYTEGTNNASYNTINFTENADVTLSQAVYGGIASTRSGMDATVSNNTINIAGTVTGSGYAIQAGTISHSEKDGEGYVTLTGNNNVINITGNAKVTNRGAMYGAFISGNSYETNHQKTIANGNEINISGNAEVNVNIIQVANSNGGYEAEASNNIATVSDNAKVTGDIYAGDAGADSSNKTGGDGKAIANNNTVIIKDNAVVDGMVSAGYSSGLIGDDGACTTEMSGNVINVEDNATVGTLIAAHVTSYAKDDTAIAKNNVVNIGDNVTVNVELPAEDDGEPHGIYGAYIASEAASYRVDSASQTIGAEGNTVNITGGTINSNVYGAYVYAQDENDISDMNASADNNTVNLSGGTIEGEVYGGYSAITELEEQEIEWDGQIYKVMVPVEVADEASDNTVSLQGDVDVSSAKLYGNNGGEGTGNKLEVADGYTGDGVINTVAEFDEIEIAKAEYGKAALTVENMQYKEADPTTGEGGTVITVKKMTMSGSDELVEGTKLNVIASENTTGDISEDSTATIYKGTSQIIEVGFGGEDATVSAITKTVRNDQVLVIGESRTAATAFVNQGSELIETGIDALVRDESQDDMKVFAALYANASKYETGSHVKVNGLSGIVGIGKTTDDGLTYGAFFENGEGNYRTFNYMDGMLMRGDGEANYNGGGLLIRKDHAKGFYAEASLRAGNLSNRLDGAVMGSEGLAGYDIDTFYYGAHIGIGKIIPKGKDSLDIYGKFLYTHHDSETFEIDGDDFHFDSIDSQRLRLGLRYNKAQTDRVGLYCGAAWEYEFGGDADNTVVGYDLSTPSLEGSTVIGELGMHYMADTRWSMDVNLRGYTGQRDGYSGSVQVNYNF